LTLRVAFAGTPAFALPALTALRAHHEVVGVLTTPDRPSGRGRRLTPSAVKSAAEAYRLPLAQPVTLKSEAAQAQLLAWHPDVLVVVAYGLLLPPAVLALPRLGCLNIHASLLPRWRGAAPIQRALLAGDPETGVSIMQMDAGLDTGAVLLTRRQQVSPEHTAGSLAEELATLGAVTLLTALEGLASGTLHGQPQAERGVTYAAKVTKAEALIDWSRPAFEIERQVRAFNPTPVAQTLFGGEQFRIWLARAATEPGAVTRSGDNPSDHAAKSELREGKSVDPGTILSVDDSSMMVQCGRGQLAISEVQRAGKRPVNVRDFAHGLTLVGRRLG
jgi:methionyl-tRNA formyltransferase